MPSDAAASETVRAFVAVEVSEAVAQRAAAIMDRLRAAGRDDVKWVDPRNFHLTLKFLGETRRSELSRLAETLREVAAGGAPFRAELSGVGAFPSVHRPEVIWLGMEAGREALTDLAAATEAACAALGWAREEKPFRAHLTLGRSRTRHSGSRPGGSAARPPAPSAYRADLIRALEAEGDTTTGFMPIERLVLVQSQLQPGGPIYTLLESFPLQRREPE